MKVHNYERKTKLLCIIFIFFVIEIIGFIILCNKKEFTYQKITGIIVKENLYEIIISKEEKKLLYTNKKIRIEDQLVPYTIEEDRGQILEKDKIKYYDLIIKSKTPKKMKTKDRIEFSILKEKKTILEILKSVWESD